MGQLSLDAYRALSQTTFGIAQRSDKVRIDGIIQHSKVLNALRPQLSDPARPGLEGLIVPVVMLLKYAVSLIALLNAFHCVQER